MMDERFEELCIEYLTESQTPSQRRELEEYFLAASPAHETLLKEITEAFHNVASTIPQERPPAHLKTQILGEIAAREQGLQEKAGRTTTGSRFWRIWGVAASILLVISIAWGVSVFREMARQQAQISSLSGEVGALKAANQGLEVRLGQLSDPRTRFLSLAGLTGFESASGTALLLGGEAKVRLYLHDLPTLAANQEYQLWVIEEGQPPHPSRVFRATGGVTELEVDLEIPADRIRVLAVTIEPAGGSPAPTGAMVVAGQFQAG